MQAQANLAVLYHNGTGVSQDYKSVVKWYTLAAERGNAAAQAKLGLLFYDGRGVLQNDFYAHM